ncbi:unnamed protein product [Sphagnum balticum]
MEFRVICSKQNLWVIYEILQAKKVILESFDSHYGAKGADITTVVPVGGPPVGANLRMSATKKTLFEYTVPDNKARAFGFRAIHARYDSTGEFVSFVHDEEWSAIPTVWGEHKSKNTDPRLDLGGLFLPPADMHNDNGDDIECLEIEGQRDTLASSLTSSSNEPAPPSEEHLGLQKMRDGSDRSTVGAPSSNFRAAHERNEPSKLEPNCGASSSRSLPPILQQSLKERLQDLKGAIGVIPTPADYVVEDHCVQHDPESVITFGWRVASEANALELLFQSAKGMSSILGVGVEFAKVLVVLASLEVKIVGIGQASWDALWQDSSNNKDDVIDLVSIARVRRPGAKLENPNNVEYLTGKQSATKYGVGLKNKSNTAHVNSTDVKPQSDCSCILDKVVEYLVLKKLIGAVMDKQCDGDDGQGSSSGVGSTKQGIAGTSSSQSLLMSNLSLRRWQKPTGGSDDDDDDETLPSRKQPHQVNHKRPTGNFCRVIVRPGAGGSFDRAGIPQELDSASIDPTLVFEFNYKHDMNGDICDKQIQIITTTSFDLGEAAPEELILMSNSQNNMSDSFGWYQNPLEVSLRNCGRAELYSPNCELKETPKETKRSAKTTDTHSKNSTLQRAGQVQGGYKTFIQVTGSANKTTSNGETIAKETASENLVFEVLKGFQVRDLRVVKKSKLKYRFDTLPPPIEVLEDREERHKYLGMGMCQTVVPTFIGTWSITDADVDEDSPYIFDAERTLNRIFKVGQVSEQKEHFVQCYRVPMYVNHAMSHLCTLKDHHILKEREILSNVLEVGIVGI